jgi:hypothetical protein
MGGPGDRSMDRPMSAPPLQGRPMSGPPPQDGGFGQDDRGYPGDRFGDRGFTGERPVVGDRSFTGERPVVEGRSFTGERPIVEGQSFTGERPFVDRRSFTGERPVIGDNGFPTDRGFPGDRGGYPGDNGFPGDRGFPGERGFAGERGFTGERPHVGGMPQAPMSPVPGGPPQSFERFDDTAFTPGGFGNFDMPSRRGRGDMTGEIHMSPDFGNGQYPGGMGSPDTSPMEAQRIDALRRTFTPRRFGSGYDAHQVNRLFDAIIASLSGRSGMPIMEAELDPNQFSLVPGGYFEAEVEQALRQVRELIR